MRRLVHTLTLASCLTMTGCLFTVDSSQKTGIAQWSPSELERIEIGQTDADWVRSTFGAPRRQSSYPDGTQVWRYENISESESEVGLFLLFNVSVEKEHAEILVIEMKDGIVSGYWVERS